MSNLRLGFTRIQNDLLGSLDATFHTLRGDDTRRLGYETYIVRDGGAFSLRHHGTDILSVRILDDTTDEVTLNAAGWRSETTANRIRMAFSAASLPVSVGVHDGDYVVYIEGRAHDYRDGMSFRLIHSRDGHVTVGNPTYPRR